MLKHFQRSSATNRLIEEKLYEQVLIEMDKGEIRAGLWAKALANGGGNEEKAKGLYIKYRVQSIRDELTVSEEFFELEIKKEREKKNARPVAYNRKTEEKNMESKADTDIEKEVVIKKPLPFNIEYFSLESFSEDSGFSIGLCEKMVKEGLYPGKEIDGIWFVHKSALSEEFLEKNY